MQGGTVAAIAIGAGALGVGGYFLLRRKPVGLPAVGAYVPTAYYPDPKMQQAQVMTTASPRAASSPSLMSALQNKAWSTIGGAADKVLPGLGSPAVSAAKSIASAGGKAIAKGLKKLKFW